VKLCRYEVQNALGHKLAHSHKGESRRIPKASILADSDIQDLLAAGLVRLKLSFRTLAMSLRMSLRIV